MSNIIMKKPRIRPTTNRLGTRKGALVANEAYSKNASATLEGDRELISENEYNKAYRNKKTGDIDVGVRGTASVGDALTDLKHLVGGDIRTTERYQDTKRFIQGLKERNKDAKINVYSHSLGGLITNKLAQESPDLISGGETYNTYALSKNDLSNKLRNVRTKNDLVSHLGRDGVETLSKDLNDLTQGNLEAHSLTNFLKMGGSVNQYREILMRNGN